MTQYHVFACPFKRPRGGMSDYIGTFNDLEEARAAGENRGDYSIAEIVPDGSLKVADFRAAKKRPPLPGTNLERFLMYAVPGEKGECWGWRGTLNVSGYAKFWGVEQKSVPAHRFYYEVVRGVKVPPELHMDHLCRNRGCVNPDHLEPVTPTENTYRGIGPTAINKHKKFCKYGHSLEGENVKHLPKGRRACKQCLAEINLMKRRVPSPGRGAGISKSWEKLPDVEKRRRVSRMVNAPNRLINSAAGIRALPPERRSESVKKSWATRRERHGANDFVCKNGHPMDENNLRIGSRGEGICKTCRAIANRKYQAKRRLSV